MLLFLSLILSKTCFGQIKPCYGFGSDFMRNKCPCDPSAKVSACCGLNYTCSTSFYCTDGHNARVIGSYTDTTFPSKLFKDPSFFVPQDFNA